MGDNVAAEGGFLWVHLMSGGILITLYLPLVYRFVILKEKDQKERGTYRHIFLWQQALKRAWQPQVFNKYLMNPHLTIPSLPGRVAQICYGLDMVWLCLPKSRVLEAWWFTYKTLVEGNQDTGGVAALRRQFCWETLSHCASWLF